MKTKTTRAHAEEAREAVAKMFPADMWDHEGLTVQEPGHWHDGDSWYVAWEEGPDDWALQVPYALVPGLFLEPYNSFVLAVTTDD